MPKNPHFTFHAVVGVTNLPHLYDPSYGLIAENAQVQLLEVSNYPGLGILENAATNGRQVFRESFADYNDNPVMADRLCKHHPDFTPTPTPTPTPPNPIAEATPFVTQHYLDFLSREPDAGGLAYWAGEITNCGTDEGCIAQRRIQVSKAFFFSVEFQQTGAFVHRVFRATHQRNPTFEEFLTNTQGITFETDSAESLAASKERFIEDWVNSDDFAEAYYAATNAQYVDVLFANAGVTPTAQERAELINGLDDETETLASVFRRVVDHPGFAAIEFNRSFVLMQYFGYLRRNVDQAGYEYWLGVLNQTGDQDGMVGAFINSVEYRARFGAP